MEYTILLINENTWRIEDGGVRFFLLTGTEKALLIDSGMNVHCARDIAASLTSLPLSLLNTHADRDHIGSNEQFEQFYLHPAEEALYQRSGKPGTILPVEDGDLLELGQRSLRILHLPGHTPGSIAVLDIQSRVLISGDPIQKNGNIFMFGNHRDLQAYVRSLERLNTLRDQFDEIWPSHAEIPISPEVIPQLCQGAQDILAGKIQGTPAEMHGQEILVYDVGVSRLLCDR